ncbi:uncharacterized protein LOC114522084 [Dendronephthya gigantea]|uniref:uncharacterized protein LOC114522084 n=1 Tax=Dendronephthya gigantea TaxID=151771 RepID=UPI001068F327|nr:uncharacterized protein LOC114522084 [Dendronephthya gigantea]XP_028398506.1 uncharacterized protein LOC114522084 [Dendronephthya gigantea]XP_028398507.1 uncharacterized protein LOC114522084 [Dendronephthya gigantea]
MDESFNFDDDITDSMTDEDLQQLENDAWRKIGAVEDNSVGVPRKVPNNGSKTRLDPTKNSVATTYRVGSRSYTPVTPLTRTQRSGEVNTTIKGQHQASNMTHQLQDSQLQQLASQLQDYKMKVEKLETTLCTKDGELKVVRKNLDACRKEVSAKVQLISKMKQEQEQERSERNSKQAQEIKMLQTQLSFQKHELMKQEFDKLQSQNVCNSQKVPIISQKVSGSVKRKAEFPSGSHGFGLDNSFHDSQAAGSKLVPQGKVPRLEKWNKSVKVEKNVGKQIESEERTINVPSTRPNTSKTDEPNETKSFLVPKSNLHPCSPSTSKNVILQSRLTSQSEKKACNLAKKLVLSYSSDTFIEGNQDLESISLLTLLKYPLKHIPEILHAHSVGKKVDQSLSQFPILQTQLQGALLGSTDKTSTDEEIDFDSGKYNLVSQGIFLLLGLPHLEEKNIDTLGVIHVLVFLELYISSYVMTWQKRIKAGIDQNCEQTCLRNSPQAGLIAGESTNDSEAQKALHDEQDMILETLQLLRLLFYSAPGLLKCILDRTNPRLFQEHSTDEDLVITFDSKRNVDVKENLKEVKEEDQVFEENAVGSFRSLLLENLQKLVNPTANDGLFLPVSHAALEVLVAMTSLCDSTDLERMIVPLNQSGCLVELLGKEECTISTVSLVISVIRNFLPCKNVHKMLCSKTDDCILLKMYQCACDEEDDKADNHLNTFLLQFIQFLKDVASSHDDSLEFLLQSDCQCSFEIVRCLVLVLYDKVSYLLDLEVEKVILDTSLALVRTGVNILVVLCTHSCFAPGHKLHVEHKFTELIYNAMTLFKRIRPHIPDFEEIALQDLLDVERLDEIEWSSGSGSETEDETRMSH